MPKVRDVLPEQNPWWTGEFELAYKEREIYAEVRRFLRLQQIVALTGLRRVGKTTLLLKAGQDALAGGLDPRRLLYFSFDEFRAVEIREVLGEYEALVERDLRTGRSLVLLDEVQKLAGWEDQIKAAYDVYKGKVKFVLSGSESLFIRAKSRESLAGRLFELKVEPLSFREYLGFKGVRYEPVGLHEKELARWFERFLRTQGFPELVDIDDRSVARKYLREGIVEKVLFRDLPLLFGIQDVPAMESLLDILMDAPGQLLELSDLAGSLKLSRKTLSKYIAYLELSFLVKKLYNFSTGRRKVERKLKKYYPSILSVDLVYGEDGLSRSRAFEWAAVGQLKADFFWRDPYKNEVDIVLGGRKPVPVEVKYGQVDTRGLRAFMDRFQVRRGYVVTRDQEEVRTLGAKRIVLVPAYKALLRPEKVLT